ncbi:MAG: insulinase family protein [Muribaculaceae bacterium]|nr:insulinase family protein [Muribaculaceae bacterium]
MEIPEISDFGSIYMPYVRVVALDNGVTLKIAPYEPSEICRFHIVMRGGTLDYDNLMIPRLTALSLFRGTPDMTHTEVASKFDFCGVNVEKRVSIHHTIFDFTVLKRLVPEILPIIAESLEAPTFDVDFIEILKRNQAQAITQIYEQPKSLAMIKFKELAYSSGSRIGRSATPDKAMRVTIDDIVETHRNMMMEGTAIIVSGDITDDIVAEINRNFGNNQFKPLNNKRYHETDNEMPDGNVIVNRDNAVQSSIVMGMKVPSRDSHDFIDTRIACCLFGGFFGSRLMQSIREEDGLTYGISSQITSIDGIGRMLITTDCDIAYTTQVKDAVITEIEKMRSTLSSAEEMHILKSYLLSQYARMVDKSMDTGDYLTSQIIMDIDSDFFNKQVSRTNEITPEQILEISQKYFIPENMLTVTITKES